MKFFEMLGPELGILDRIFFEIYLIISLNFRLLSAITFIIKYTFILARSIKRSYSGIK
jgi:hypothetical protein